MDASLDALDVLIAELEEAIEQTNAYLADLRMNVSDKAA